MSEIRFTVVGRPEPGGSKTAFVINGRAVVSDANKKVKGWRSQVADAASGAYAGPLLDGPLEAEFTFFTPRPKSHYRSGKNAALLKDSAPEHPTTRPDALKLARAVEDALTGVLYRDDSQIVNEHLHKRYGEPARCEAVVRTIAEAPELALAA